MNSRLYLRNISFILAIILIFSIGFTFAQSDLNAEPWGDDEDHEVWHSGEDVQTKIGLYHFSLQDVIDGNYDDESFIWDQSEHKTSHHADHIRVRVNVDGEERFFSLQRFISNGLQFLVGTSLPGDSGGETVRTINLRAAGDKEYSEVCDTREGYTGEGHKYVEYNREIQANNFVPGETYSVTCSYDGEEGESVSIILDGNFKKIGEGEERHVRRIGLIGSRKVYSRNTDTFEYYAAMVDDEIKIRVQVDDKGGVDGMCPFYKVPKGFGLRSETIYEFKEMSCTVVGGSNAE